MRKIKLLFLIDSLNPGGAQQQLYELVKGLDKMSFEISIITWYPGVFFEDLRSMAGIELMEVKRKSKFDFSPLLKALKLIRERKIEIVHAYLDSACFYGAVCKIFFRRIIFIATERSSFKNLTWLQKIHKPVSHHLANLTIANSYAGANYLEQLGVDRKKIVVIRNGIDTGRLVPTMNQINDFMTSAQFSRDERVILMAGRITKLKNQLLVLEAYASSTVMDNFIMLFVGTMDMEYGIAIREFINRKNLHNKVFILNASSNMALFYFVSEVVVLFSDFEGSPNVVLEAMASGRSVISSDVGDVRYFVDNSFGWILPVRDRDPLMSTFNSIAQMSTQELLEKGKLAFEKFNELQLSTAAMVARHVALYSELTST